MPNRIRHFQAYSVVEQACLATAVVALTAIPASSSVGVSLLANVLFASYQAWKNRPNPDNVDDDIARVAGEAFSGVISKIKHDLEDVLAGKRQIIATFDGNDSRRTVLRTKAVAELRRPDFQAKVRGNGPLATRRRIHDKGNHPAFTLLTELGKQRSDRHLDAEADLDGDSAVRQLSGWGTVDESMLDDLIKSRLSGYPHLADYVLYTLCTNWERQFELRLADASHQAAYNAVQARRLWAETERQKLMNEVVKDTNVVVRDIYPIVKDTNEAVRELSDQRRRGALHDLIPVADLIRYLDLGGAWQDRNIAYVNEGPIKEAYDRVLDALTEAARRHPRAAGINGVLLVGESYWGKTRLVGEVLRRAECFKEDWYVLNWRVDIDPARNTFPSEEELRDELRHHRRIAILVDDFQDCFPRSQEERDRQFTADDRMGSLKALWDRSCKAEANASVAIVWIFIYRIEHRNAVLPGEIDPDQGGRLFGGALSKVKLERISINHDLEVKFKRNGARYVDEAKTGLPGMMVAGIGKMREKYGELLRGGREGRQAATILHAVKLLSLCSITDTLTAAGQSEYTLDHLQIAYYAVRPRSDEGLELDRSDRSNWEGRLGRLHSLGLIEEIRRRPDANPFAPSEVVGVRIDPGYIRDVIEHYPPHDPRDIYAFEESIRILLGDLQERHTTDSPAVLRRAAVAIRSLDDYQFGRDREIHNEWRAIRRNLCNDIYDQLLFVDPDNVEDLHGKAATIYVLSRDRDEFAEALDPCDRALQINDKDTPALRIKALTLIELKNYEEAVEVCETGLALEPGSAILLRLRADAQRKLGNRAAAIDDYRRALTYNPSIAAVWVALGDTLREHDPDNRQAAEETHEEALALYDRRMASAGNDTDLWKTKGDVLHKLRRLDAALAAYQRIERGHRDASLWNRLGNVQFDLQMYAEACDAYREAIRLARADGAGQADSGVYLRNLGNSLRRLGFQLRRERGDADSAWQDTLDEALNVYSQVGEEARNATWYRSVVEVSSRLERDDDAVEAYCRAVECGISDSWMDNFLGYMYARQGNYVAAVQHIENAITLAPIDPNFHDSKGEILLLKGDRTAARDAFLKAVSLRPIEETLQHLIRMSHEDSDADGAARFEEQLQQMKAREGEERERSRVREQEERQVRDFVEQLEAGDSSITEDEMRDTAARVILEHYGAYMTSGPRKLESEAPAAIERAALGSKLLRGARRDVNLTPIARFALLVNTAIQLCAYVGPADYLPSDLCWGLLHVVEVGPLSEDLAANQQSKSPALHETRHPKAGFFGLHGAMTAYLTEHVWAHLGILPPRDLLRVNGDSIRTLISGWRVERLELVRAYFGNQLSTLAGRLGDDNVEALMALLALDSINHDHDYGPIVDGLERGLWLWFGDSSRLRSRETRDRKAPQRPLEDRRAPLVQMLKLLRAATPLVDDGP